MTSTNNDPYATVEQVIPASKEAGSPAARLTLEVHYDHKQALIELPAAAPLFFREPITEVARRSLQELIEALEATASSPPSIFAPARRRSRS